MKVITLCGSNRFKEDFDRVSQALTLDGNVVLGLSVYSKFEMMFYDWANDPKSYVPLLREIHRQKIMMADEIFIIDPSGYVGSDTQREIDFARDLGRPIRYLSKETI